MGITGLLPFVKKASSACFLREFSGSVVAVDTYCWLHKGAFSCADKLVRGEDTDGYVVYVMKMVRLLLSNRIKPIMVFDGCNLPSKAGTETKRREARRKNRALAKELLREGRIREARECFQRCIDVTSHMARRVVKACRDINVDVIVAPYEADAQLAYLMQEGFADIVITEDSDLLLFGCQKVIFKLDSSGGGVLVEQNKLHLTMGVPADKFSLELFRNMCILSGCDYLPSLPGIGLAKACKFFTRTVNTDIFNALCKLPANLNMPGLEVPLEYREGFMRARATFLYQLVFCPRSRRLRPLEDDSHETEGPSSRAYAGEFIGHERAEQIALANIDLESGDTVDDFDPATHQPPPMKSSSWYQSGDMIPRYSSIWQPDYDSKNFGEEHTTNNASTRPSLMAFAANKTSQLGSENGEMKEVEETLKDEKKRKPAVIQKVVDLPLMFAKRRLEEDEEKNEMSSLAAFYACPSKAVKLEINDQQSKAPSEAHNEIAEVVNPFAKDIKKTESSDSIVMRNPFAKYMFNSTKNTQNIGENKQDNEDIELSTQDTDEVSTSQNSSKNNESILIHEAESDDIDLNISNASLDISCSKKTESPISNNNTTFKKKTSTMKISLHGYTSAAVKRKVIVKSRYFRPVDDLTKSPAKSIKKIRAETPAENSPETPPKAAADNIKMSAEMMDKDSDDNDRVLEYVEDESIQETVENSQNVSPLTGKNQGKASTKSLSNTSSFKWKRQSLTDSFSFKSSVGCSPASNNIVKKIDILKESPNSSCNFSPHTKPAQETDTGDISQDELVQSSVVIPHLEKLRSYGSDCNQRGYSQESERSGLSQQSSVLNDSMDQESFGLTPVHRRNDNDSQDNLADKLEVCPDDASFRMDQDTMELPDLQPNCDAPSAKNLTKVLLNPFKKTVEPQQMPKIHAVLEQTDNTLVSPERVSPPRTPHASEYFPKKPCNTKPQSACRRPGLSKVKKLGSARQLNLKDMFAYRRT